MTGELLEKEKKGLFLNQGIFWVAGKARVLCKSPLLPFRGMERAQVTDYLNGAWSENCRMVDLRLLHF